MNQLKDKIRQAIQSTLVVSNMQSFDYTWKAIVPVLEKHIKDKAELMYDLHKVYDGHFDEWSIEEHWFFKTIESLIKEQDDAVSDTTMPE